MHMYVLHCGKVATSLQSATHHLFPLNLDFFLGIETFKIVESLHHYHDKSLRQDEFVRNSAKTNEKHYTIPDSKRGFFQTRFQ